MAVTTKKAPGTGKLKVRVTEAKVQKSQRAESVRANSQVRTKTGIDFVKAVRGR
jgi:hypothetical protein